LSNPFCCGPCCACSEPHLAQGGLIQSIASVPGIGGAGRTGYVWRGVILSICNALTAISRYAAVTIFLERHKDRKVSSDPLGSIETAVHLLPNTQSLPDGLAN
jgi:hypothetical protein